MKMIGVWRERLRSRISLAVVNPSMPGMRTSSRIAAKSSSRTWRSACSPECAVTRREPSVARTSFIASTFPGSSSTMRMPACREAFTWSLLRQHQQRVAAEDARGRVGIHAVERLARPFQELRLPAQVAELGAARRVEMIDDTVAAVLERRERGLLGEVMQVPHRAARVDERPPAEHHLRRKLERNVEDL